MSRRGSRNATIIFAVAALAAAAYTWRSGRRTDVVREYEPGSYQDLIKRQRQTTTQTPSTCEEGPPSAEAQAWWSAHRKRRELDSIAMADLVHHDDHDLAFEVDSRLLDKREATGLGGLTRQEQNVQLVFMLDGEVRNGGFHQFFANSSGNCATRTMAAVAEIGNPRITDIYTRALAVFPAGAPSEDRAERGVQMERIPHEFEAWRSLDDEYYAADRGITAAIAAYVRAHLGAFVLPAAASGEP